MGGEGTDGSDDETTDGSDDEENTNPDTGSLITVAPIILSAIAITVSRKRK